MLLLRQKKEGWNLNGMQGVCPRKESEVGRRKCRTYKGLQAGVLPEKQRGVYSTRDGQICYPKTTDLGAENQKSLRINRRRILDYRECPTGSMRYLWMHGSATNIISVVYRPRSQYRAGAWPAVRQLQCSYRARQRQSAYTYVGDQVSRKPSRIFYPSTLCGSRHDRDINAALNLVQPNSAGYARINAHGDRSSGAWMAPRETTVGEVATHREALTCVH